MSTCREEEDVDQNAPNQEYDEYWIDLIWWSWWVARNESHLLKNPAGAPFLNQMDSCTVGVVVEMLWFGKRNKLHKIDVDDEKSLSVHCWEWTVIK